MKIAKRDILYYEHSRFNKPGLSVMPGEVFEAETEMCSGDWLRSIEDKWTPDKSKGPNPTVCVEIIGAKPGDMLAVKILDIQVNEIGYTGFDGSIFALPHLIHRRDWGITTKTVQIKDGWIEWSDRIKLPVKPMIGTFGVAPKFEVIRNHSAGAHGGNMDVQEVTSGSTVYLPVFVEGALLHIGDAHAIQGDGEINSGGGVECRSKVRMSIDVVKNPPKANWIRVENEDYIMAISCGRSVEECFNNAAGELLLWMTDEYGFSHEEAYLLMGQVMEARATQYVNPSHSYVCKMPKKYL